MLLHYWHRTGQAHALHMVEKTLASMAQGGIRDHLGGGFHRYSTDARWLVPHFEKMLYDQALLGRIYVQAYQITKNEFYADVARGICDYVLRDMTDVQGGFCAAEDADSEGREGAFYVWRKDGIERVLGRKAASVFCRAYGVTNEGNFEGGENILHNAVSVGEVAREFELTEQEVETILAEARRCLFEHRSARPRPLRDDKIITAWNGLMISSMACAGAVLGVERYVKAAENAADFVLTSLRTDGRLRRYFRAGRAVEKAFLDDYAFMILGLVDLYGACFDPRFLREAKDLAEQMIDLFADEDGGGFFTTGRDAEPLLSRDKPSYDGAVPSGNSVAALALLRLGKLLMDSRFTEQGQRTLQAFTRSMAEWPTNASAMLLALDYWLGPTQEIVIAGTDPEEGALVAEVRRHFLPNATVVFHADEAGIAELVPFVGNHRPVDGRATAYVCADYACRRPVATTEGLREILVSISQRD
jgi:uncharacterized protein YyaL (SSP411 family)